MGLDMFEENNPLLAGVRRQVPASLQTPFLTLSESHLLCVSPPRGHKMGIHICRKWENKCTRDPDAQLLY